MKMGELKNNESGQGRYVSPQVNVIEVNAQKMLCQSVSTIKDMTLRDDDSNYWK